ncbi:MAG TPA: carboxypeptidase-like regulatory domain-containing protein [Acidimicrobiales bacterium]|nr:carboxypeptidase-like regulatory domain-containing protein [Acidimicrobiales bacterium]
MEAVLSGDVKLGISVGTYEAFALAHCIFSQPNIERASMSKRLCSRVLAVSASVAFFMLGLAPAGAIEVVGDLYAFHGGVSDPVGRLLPGVRVLDGKGRSATTNATGQYRLGEQNTGTYTLSTSRTGLKASSSTVTVTLPLDTAVDFVARYNLTAAPSGADWRYLSTANGGKTFSLAITSWAPSPGTPGIGSTDSCVRVTDSRTSAVSFATMELQNSDGSYALTFDLPLSTATSEGSYWLQVDGVTCAGGTTLSDSYFVNYVVDNTAPVVDNLQPRDRQMVTDLGPSDRPPVTARIQDTGPSGIDPTQTTVSVVDATTGSELSLALATSTEAFVRTQPLNLTRGHVYRAVVTVADYAGNMATVSHGDHYEEGGFLFTYLDGHAAGVSFDVPCSVNEGEVFATSTVASCDNVIAQVAASTITVGPTSHSGTGYVEDVVGLSAAKVEYKLGVLTRTETPVSAGGDWTARRISRPFVVSHSADSLSPQDRSLSPTSVNFGTLSLTVPKLASDVRIILGVRLAPPGASFPETDLCSDPTRLSSEFPCRTDPLENDYLVDLMDGVSPGAKSSSDSASFGATIQTTFDAPNFPVSYLAAIPWKNVASVQASTGVIAVIPAVRDWRGDQCNIESSVALRLSTTDVCVRDHEPPASPLEPADFSCEGIEICRATGEDLLATGFTEDEIRDLMKARIDLDVVSRGEPAVSYGGPTSQANSAADYADRSVVGYELLHKDGPEFRGLKCANTTIRNGYCSFLTYLRYRVSNGVAYSKDFTVFAAVSGNNNPDDRWKTELGPIPWDGTNTPHYSPGQIPGRSDLMWGTALYEITTDAKSTDPVFEPWKYWLSPENVTNPNQGSPIKCATGNTCASRGQFRIHGGRKGYTRTTIYPTLGCVRLSIGDGSDAQNDMLKFKALLDNDPNRGELDLYVMYHYETFPGFELPQVLP